MAESRSTGWHVHEPPAKGVAELLLIAWHVHEPPAKGVAELRVCLEGREGTTDSADGADKRRDWPLVPPLDRPRPEGKNADAGDAPYAAGIARIMNHDGAMPAGELQHSAKPMIVLSTDRRQSLEGIIPKETLEYLQSVGVPEQLELQGLRFVFDLGFRPCLSGDAFEIGDVDRGFLAVVLQRNTGHMGHFIPDSPTPEFVN